MPSHALPAFGEIVVPARKVIQTVCNVECQLVLGAPARTSVGPVRLLDVHEDLAASGFIETGKRGEGETDDVGTPGVIQTAPVDCFDAVVIRQNDGDLPPRVHVARREQ